MKKETWSLRKKIKVDSQCPLKKLSLTARGKWKLDFWGSLVSQTCGISKHACALEVWGWTLAYQVRKGLVTGKRHISKHEANSPVLRQNTVKTYKT